MKKVISKKVLVLLSLLLFLPLFSGCFLAPSVNQTPTITSTPITTATVDEPYTYDVDATDPDGDTLTYSLTTNPTGMTIDSATGLINWTPTSAQIGDHNVTVEVSDGKKSTTQSFTVKVYDILTSIVVLPEAMTLFVGKSNTITSIMASYNYGADQSIALATCSYDSNTTAVATVVAGVITGVSDGSATITVEYTEGAITKTDTVAVEVVADLLIDPSSITVSSGNPFTIEIVVENVTELQGVNVTLSFDDSKIDYTTAAAGAFLPAPIFFPPSAGSVTDQVLLSIAGTGIPPYASGTGTVLTVTFNALAAGSTDITFYLTNLRHDVYTPIPHKVKGECSVTVN